jgi:hypothetical protein
MSYVICIHRLTGQTKKKQGQAQAGVRSFLNSTSEGTKHGGIMIDLLRTIPTVVLLPLLMVAGAIPCVLVLLWVRARSPLEKLRAHHDVTGAIFNVIGVLYTVLLAFMMVTVWERYRTTEEVCEAEANGVSNLHRDSYVLPDECQIPVRQALIDYARAVVDREWESMIDRQAHPDAVEAMNHIWQVYYSVKPKTENQKIWYAESVDKLNDMAGKRRLRILSCKTRISWVMWTLLLVGGVLTLGYMNLFGLESFRIHMIMTVSLAILLILILFIIYSLDNPFWGDPHIAPEAFQRFLEAHPTPAP